MLIPKISKAIIRNNSNTSSYNRGEDYYENEAVSDLKIRGNLIQAEVEGSKLNEYQVSIEFDASEITSAYCTCPYDNDGWCKHIVATLLTCSLANKIIEERPTLEHLLNRLGSVVLFMISFANVKNRLTSDLENFQNYKSHILGA